MVKRIDAEEMKASTKKAEALKNEASKGLGTPLERRLADAIIENAQNLDAHTKAMEEILAKAEEMLVDAHRAAEESRAAAEYASRISERTEIFQWETIEAIERGSSEGVRKAFDEECEHVVSGAEERLATASKSAEKALRTTEEAGNMWAYRAQREGWFHSLTTIGKILAIACILGCTLMTVWAGWRALPLVRGEVQIVYTEEYQSELDEAHSEIETLRYQLTTEDQG